MDILLVVFTRFFLRVFERGFLQKISRINLRELFMKASEITEPYCTYWE